MFPLPENLLTAGVLALSVINAIALVWIVRLELRIRRMMRGASGADLEKTLSSLEKDIRASKVFERETGAYLAAVERRLSRALSGIATVRYDPFRGSGTGRQSFACALIDEHGDGVVISTVNARERVGIYAKPIRELASDYELSEEEKHALKEAAGRQAATMHNAPAR